MVLRFLMLLAFFVFSCADYERDNVYDSKRKNSQYETCGEWNFNPKPDKGPEQKCENNVIKRKCGSNWYKASDSTTTRCKNNVIETKCGNSWYDDSNSTLRCQNDVVEKKCGSGNYWYDTTNTNFRCQNNVVEKKCNTGWYDYSKENNTWKCQNDVVLKACGSNWYDTTNANFRCQNNVVETRCGSGNWYDAYNSSLRCQNDVVKKKCDIYWNDIDRENDTWRCQNGSLQKMCDTWYNVATNYCSTDYVSTRYGSLTDSRDYKTYKTFIIDDQIWMAENLNFVTSDSKCYSNSETNCNTYGRLYDWYEAKTVCPSGWHSPESDELINLMYYITDDDYNFALLLGGSYTNSFSNKDKAGFWWSITPGDVTSEAYSQKISFEEEIYSIEEVSLSKSNLLSVRCIKNE